MTEDSEKLSLVVSVRSVRSVRELMVGAGIFALVGQMAGLAGGLVPAAFLAGAVVIAFSSYSYVKYSGNMLVECSATVSAAVKIIGLAALAIAGKVASGRGTGAGDPDGANAVGGAASATSQRSKP